MELKNTKLHGPFPGYLISFLWVKYPLNKHTDPHPSHFFLFHLDNTQLKAYMWPYAQKSSWQNSASYMVLGIELHQPHSRQELSLPAVLPLQTFFFHFLKNIFLVSSKKQLSLNKNLILFHLALKNQPELKI